MVSAALIFILSTIPAELVALPVSIIICREIAVSALREWMAQRNIHHAVKVGNLGKIKTTLQMLAATTLLLVYKSIDTTDMSIASTMGFSLVKLVLIGILLLYSAAIASLVSGIQYFIAASKVIAYENTTCQTKYSITTTHQEVNQAKCQN
jgi:phosphatidylglycerophosphate synthase